jgi:hypothetical protein
MIRLNEAWNCFIEKVSMLTISQHSILCAFNSCQIDPL